MVHQIAPSAFKMKKGGGHIFQLSLICTLKAIEVIKKVKKRKKDWVTELWQINTLCDDYFHHYHHLHQHFPARVPFALCANKERQHDKLKTLPSLNHQY